MRRVTVLCVVRDSYENHQVYEEVLYPPVGIFHLHGSGLILLLLMTHTGHIYVEQEA